MQVINGENLIQCLFDKGFATPDSVVNSEVKIIPVSSRNRNFKISFANRPGYLVKQINAADEEKMFSLQQEATIFWLVKNDPLYRSLSPFVPAFHDFDAADHLLVIELIENSSDLVAYYKSNNRIDGAVFERLSEAFAATHSISAQQINESESAVFFSGKIPWIFFIGPGHNLPTKNNIDVQIMNLVRSNKEFIFHIEQLKSEWSPECLIHGDVKWANILVTDHNEIKIIDWEIADTGDPAWDIAGIFQSVLNSWYFSSNGLKNPNEQFLGAERVSLQSFWDSYCQKMGYSGEERNRRLQKAVSYTALRVIQTCIESTYKAKGLYDNTARYLQLAHNILRYRDEAQTELFGIE